MLYVALLNGTSQRFRMDSRWSNFPENVHLAQRIVGIIYNTRFARFSALDLSLNCTPCPLHIQSIAVCSYFSGQLANPGPESKPMPLQTQLDFYLTPALSPAVHLYSVPPKL